MLLFVSLIFRFPQPANAQEGHIPPGLGGTYIGPWTVGIQARYTAAYRSYISENEAFPYRTDEMLCTGEFWGVDLLVHLERERFRHYFTSTYAFPAGLRSPVRIVPENAPDGEPQAGNPPVAHSRNPGYIRFDSTVPDVLREPASSYHRLHFQYYFNLPLYRVGRLRSWYGLSSSVLYEKRELRFLSGLSEEKREISVGLGPTLAAEVFLSRRFAFRGEAHMLFYTPYSSFGQVRSLVWDGENGQMVARDGDYQHFFVANLLDGKLKYFPNRHLHLHLGYRFVTQNGHALQTAESPERLTYKLDRLHEVYLGFHLNIPSTWRKRKTNPPCPLSDKLNRTN